MSLAWTQALIDDEKTRIREQIGAWRQSGGSEAVLRHIFTKISTLDARSAKDRLRLYLLSMYGLIAHRESGLLTDMQSSKLSMQCFTVLRLQKIDSEFSKLAYLYADVHAIEGQIRSKAGRHWGGIWQQLSGRRYLREADALSSNFHDYTLVQRYLRLGMLDEAEELLLPIVKQSSETAQNSYQWCSAVLTHLIVLRLKSEFKAADDLSAHVLKMSTFPSDLRLDVQWEALCRQVATTGDCRSMIQAVRDSHAKPCYIVEAYLWEQASGQTNFKRAGFSLEDVAKKQRKAFRDLGALYTIARAIENCGDTDSAPGLRLEKLGRAIEESRQLTTIDEELLIWLAAGNALKRARFSTFSRTCIFEYEALGKRLANSIDILGLKNGKSMSGSGHD